MTVRRTLALLASIALLAAPAAAEAMPTTSPAPVAVAVEPAVVSVKILSQAGHPLLGVEVQLIKQDVDDGRVVASGWTDVDGKVTFKGVPVTRYDHHLIVKEPAGTYATTYSASFTLAPGSTTSRTVRVKPAAVVVGTLNEIAPDSDLTRPASGALATAEGVDGTGGLYDVTVDHLGRYRIGALPAGTYELSFRASGTTLCYTENPRPGVGRCANPARVVLKAGTVTELEPQVLDRRKKG